MRIFGISSKEIIMYNWFSSERQHLPAAMRHRLAAMMTKIVGYAGHYSASFNVNYKLSKSTTNAPQMLPFGVFACLLLLPKDEIVTKLYMRLGNLYNICSPLNARARVLFCDLRIVQTAIRSNRYLLYMFAHAASRCLLSFSGARKYSFSHTLTLDIIWCLCELRSLRVKRQQNIPERLCAFCLPQIYRVSIAILRMLVPFAPKR